MEIVDRRFNQSVFLFFLFLEFDTIVFAFVILRSVMTSVMKYIRIQLVLVIRLWLGYAYKGMIGGKSENENDLIPLFCYLLDKRDVK